ncbi:cyclin-A2-1-like protein [Carex littledalei]|uniref:Cyclin-A2-1-like protein n=1 Tax=Carex littledalei TaxID=544730 RepID=A0A833QIT7_9POAL|nr:cyclin-A2-1-like protein [Carex littledalei]
MDENVEPMWGELLEDPAAIEPRPPRIYRNYFDLNTKDQQRGSKQSDIVSPNLKIFDVDKATETTRLSYKKSGIIPFKEIGKNQVLVCKQQLLCATEMEDKQNSSITGLQHHIGGITRSRAAAARANGGAPPLVRLKKPDPPKRKTTRGGVSDENATEMMIFTSLGNEKGKPTRANGGAPPLVPLKKPDPPKRKTTRGVVSDENAAQMMVFSSLGNEKGKPKDAVSDTMGQQKGRAKRPVLTNVKCNIGPEMKVKMTDLCAGTKKGRGKRPVSDVDTHNGAGTTLVVPNKRRVILREVPNVLSDGVLTGARAFLMNPDTINGDTTSSGIVNIDCEKSNILMCSIYASDIYNNFRANELIGRPSSDFLEILQTDVTQNKRAVLMDWLVEVCEEYSLVPDTLFLTVHLIDRFLSMNKIERQRLQLLGVTCMLIASKYEETCAPRVQDLCLLTCNSYTDNEVPTIHYTNKDYCLFLVLTDSYYRLTIASGTTNGEASAAHPELMHLTNYLAELALVEYSFLKFLPSMIAAAAVFLGQWNLDQSTHPWNKTLEHYTGYKSSDMKNCILALRDLQVNTKNCPLRTIRYKYWHDKYSSVAYQTSPELPCYLFC